MNSARTTRQITWLRCAWLTTASVLLWIALAGPAWLIGGREGLIGLSAAAGLCLVPGWIVFWMADAFSASGGMVPLVILSGTALRMMFVLVGILVVQSIDRHLGFREFVVWLLAYYLSLLAVETFLVLPRPGRAGSEPRAGGA